MIKEVYFGLANFRLKIILDNDNDCLLGRAWLAEWVRQRPTSSSSSTPGWEPTIRAHSLRKTLVVLTVMEISSFVAGTKCAQQDQNIANGSCARYLFHGSSDIHSTSKNRSECQALIILGLATPPAKKMPTQMLPKTSVPTLSEVGKCARTSCQHLEQGVKHLVWVFQDLQQEAILVVHPISTFA